MRISRIYTGRAMAVNDLITLDTASAHYARNVLRLKSGAKVDLFSEHHQADYRATLQVAPKQCVAAVESVTEYDNDSNFKINLLLGLSRGDHLDWSIQKATELGVSSMTLFNADHSQMPIKPSQRDKKMAHWKAVTIKACEQCRRHLIPALMLHKNLTAALEQSTSSDHNWVTTFEGERFQAMDFNINCLTANLLIGPEGGLSAEEINQALDHGYQAVTLGPRVLRTETAVTAGITIIQSRIGDI